MINFLNLHYFVLVAEKNNMTRVAEDEHITQQSLSKHIKKIEDELGVSLIDRSSGCKLTYAGERFYDYAVRLLKVRDEMQNEMLDIKKSTHGNLRLGITYTRGKIFLPEVLPPFCEQNPFVKVTITENNPHTLEEYLLHGHIDLFIGTDIRKHPEIETVNLFSDKLYLIVPKSIARKVLKDTPNVVSRSMNIKDFSQHDFVMLTRGNPIRTLIDSYMRENRVSLSFSLETESAETMFALSCKGLGIAIYNGLFLKMHSEMIRSPDCPICIIPIKDAVYSGKMSIAYSKGKYLSDAAKKFIEAAKDIYSSSYSTKII